MIKLFAKVKKPLLFAVSLLPVAIVGGIFTGRYLIDTLAPEALQEVIAQVGDVNILSIVTIVQTITYALVCGFLGYIITEKIGLIKPFEFKSKGIVVGLVFGAIPGILIAIDHFTTGAVYPAIQTANISGFTFDGVMASILYGGIIEEVMLRLFFMAILALIIWKLFFRKYTADNMPQKVYIIANVVASLAFAAGHLPATIGIFGTLTPVIVIRCFVLNGLGGYLFGEAFRKYGIGYAMIAHATAHIVKFIIFAIFI
ncbi:MAG: CPBP family glutamic-type intramembrane protease [Acutalibacteraceae bacterium]|nr:CPBP family glutamic-type intramembrane protease [Acutalibacteraceae bacterium]